MADERRTASFIILGLAYHHLLRSAPCASVDFDHARCTVLVALQLGAAHPAQCVGVIARPRPRRGLAFGSEFLPRRHGDSVV